MKRLLLATINPQHISHIDFASGDSINRPGYDGVLRILEGAPLVSAGQSVWEIGVDQKPGGKASDDYKTRTADPGEVVPGETTFVFVTPRRWNNKVKGKWIEKRLGEKVWRDVQVIDADDLMQWLDRCPAVAAWARRQIVGVPDGLRDFEDVWQGWALHTKPPLAPALFTAGRGEAVSRVRQWLDGLPAALRVRANSADEAAGFIAAVVQSLDPPDRDRIHARAVLVTTADAWRFVAGGRTSAVVLTTDPALGSDSLAVGRGHHVAVAYGNDSAGVPVDIELPPLRRGEMEAALRGMGVPDVRSREIANESRGRIAAVVDLLGGATVAPSWASPAEAPDLIPFFLAGAWSQTPGDLDAVARLAETTPQEVSRRVARWGNETDPPIRVVAGMWEWVSRKRAWPHLGRFVTAANLVQYQVTSCALVRRLVP